MIANINSFSLPDAHRRKRIKLKEETVKHGKLVRVCVLQHFPLLVFIIIDNIVSCQFPGSLKNEIKHSNAAKTWKSHSPYHIKGEYHV